MSTNAELDAQIIAMERRAEVRERPRPRLVPIPWGELHLLPQREPLIDGLLDVGAMSAIVGATGSYKTGIAIDWGGHVSFGMPWRGRPVRRGGVLYLAVEGGRGIAERLDAWRRHHGVDADQARFFVIPEPIDLSHGEADARLLIQRIGELGGIDLAFADTVSRALAGGDENSPKDLGAFVRNCDLIRSETGVHLCGLHHLGKDESRGARGHSLLKAALDTEITATKTGQIGSIEITKQRDGAGGARWGFGIEVVHLDGGKQSYVVVDADAPPTTRASRWTRGLAVFRDATLEALSANGQEHRPRGDGPLVKAVHVRNVRTQHETLYVHNGTGDRTEAERKAWSRALRTARDSNLIGAENDLLWLVT